jgi:predicted metal-binding protein
MADGMPVFRTAPAPQRLLTCTACRHCNAPCAPGLDFLHRLGAAVAVAAGATSAAASGDFELTGTASLPCCARLCPVTWRATGRGTWLFCGVDPAAPLEALMVLAEGAEGGAEEGENRPVPAAMIVAGQVTLQ